MSGMLGLLDQEYIASIPVLPLPQDLGQPAATLPDTTDCQGCAAFRPAPQLSGNLQVDPEIHLPSPGMDVDIAYFYNATDTTNGVFGYGRTLSPFLTAQASGSPRLVTLTRGNGALVSYLETGAGSGVFDPKTPGLFNSLISDGTYWKESTPDGFTTAYPYNATGVLTTVAYLEDAVGNRHTFLYGDGVLESIQDAVGRRVTFSHTKAPLLESIQDWAGRKTTFQYDTATASPRNLLTTVMGPTGCQTLYQYATFTLEGGTSDWLLSGILDPNNYGTSYTYDQQRRVRTRVVAAAGVTTYLYQPGKMWSVDALGNRTTFALDSNFAPTAETDALGNVTTFTRNSQMQPTSRQNALGNIWTTSYNSAGLVTERQNPLGYRTTLQYDSYNNLTTLLYADGSIVTQLFGYGGSSFDTTGAKRRMQASVDQLGNRTSYSYNSRGQLAATQDALGNITTYGYDLRRESRMKDCRTLLIRSDSTCRPIGSTLRGRAARQRAV